MSSQPFKCLQTRAQRVMASPQLWALRDASCVSPTRKITARFHQGATWKRRSVGNSLPEFKTPDHARIAPCLRCRRSLPPPSFSCFTSKVKHWLTLQPMNRKTIIPCIIDGRTLRIIPAGPPQDTFFSLTIAGTVINELIFTYRAREEARGGAPRRTKCATMLRPETVSERP